MQLVLLVDEVSDKALVKQLSGQLGSYLASCLLMVAYLSQALVGSLLSVAVSRRWFVASDDFMLKPLVSYYIKYQANSIDFSIKES